MKKETNRARITLGAVPVFSEDTCPPRDEGSRFKNHLLGLRDFVDLGVFKARFTFDGGAVEGEATIKWAEGDDDAAHGSTTHP